MCTAVSQYLLLFEAYPRAWGPCKVPRYRRIRRSQSNELWTSWSIACWSTQQWTLARYAERPSTETFGQGHNWKAAGCGCEWWCACRWLSPLSCRWSLLCPSPGTGLCGGVEACRFYRLEEWRGHRSWPDTLWWLGRLRLERGSQSVAAYPWLLWLECSVLLPTRPKCRILIDYVEVIFAL